MNIERIETMINVLRNSPNIRQSFDMSSYIALNTFNPHNVCGTVGCIAGKAVMLFERDLLLDLKQRNEDIYENIYFMVRGATLLGITAINASHLFTPDMWQRDVMNDYTWESLSHNERPNLDTVAKMKAFADSWGLSANICESIGPDQAANALSGLLSHPGYVDWREAVEA